MVIALIFCSLILAQLAGAVTVSMIPKTGTPPSARDTPGFTLEEESNKLYVYGGRFESPLGDMWEFDLSSESWREIHFTSSINPGPRFDPYLVSLGNGKILLFGGNTKSGPVSDLWEFDIENQYVRYIQWKLLNDKGSPPPRSYYGAMCHYEEDGKKYLAVYGGTGVNDYIKTFHV
jgi:hypothetical protein